MPGVAIVVVSFRTGDTLARCLDDAHRAAFVDSAATLCQRVRAKSPKARIVFYETWARHADFWNPKAKDFNPLVGKDPTEMQARIRLWYGNVAKANDAVVAPALAQLAARPRAHVEGFCFVARPA